MTAFQRAIRTPTLVTLLASVLALGFAACSANSGSAEAESSKARSLSEPIIGGYLDTETHGVVALAYRYKGQSLVFCSGSLLTPNLVLTARHCIAPIGDGKSESVDCATSTFNGEYDAHQMVVSTDAQPQSTSGPLYSVSQILEAPGSSNVCGFDVALLILNSNVPGSAATPIEPVLTVSTKVKQTFSAVGYGLQDPKDTKGTTAGSRMRFDSSDVYCVGNSCPTGSGAASDEFVGDSPVCSGDSGGPALDADGKVFGVTSRGDTDCTFALYSNVVSWASFVRSTARDAAALGNYDVPAWAVEPNGATPLPAGGASGVDTSLGHGGSGGGGGGGRTNGSAGSAAGGSSDSDEAGAANDAPPPVQAITPTVDPLGAKCESADECPGTYQCYSASSKPPGICVPPCSQKNATCPPDYTCSDSLKVCTPEEEKVVKSEASASCALGVRGQSPSGAWAVVLGLGGAWLGRRRRLRRLA